MRTIHVMFLDFEKDNLRNLTNVVVTSVINFVVEFLSNRTQKVKVGESLSRVVKLRGG